MLMSQVEGRLKCLPVIIRDVQAYLETKRKSAMWFLAYLWPEQHNSKVSTETEQLPDSNEAEKLAQSADWVFLQTQLALNHGNPLEASPTVGAVEREEGDWEEVETQNLDHSTRSGGSNQAESIDENGEMNNGNAAPRSTPEKAHLSKRQKKKLREREKKIMLQMNSIQKATTE